MSKDFDTSLLDMSIDDIEDLPSFSVPPNGEYLLKLSMQFKEINNKQAVEATFEVLETVKLNNDADAPGKVGDKFSSLFFVSGEPESVKISLGKLKELLAGVAEATGEGNVLRLVRDVLADAVVRATVKRRADKEDKEKFYASVANMTLA